jgi:antitoxin (DNA-binding transcriptional repressor) of toxin-antitoxin stability system
MGMVPLPRTPAVQSSTMPLREARMQLVRLVALAELNDTVTVITDGGRPRAAIVPAGAARSLAQLHHERQRAAAAAAGWERRVEEARDVSRRQHASEAQALRRALREAWSCIDGGNAHNVEVLRRAHADLLHDQTTEPAHADRLRDQTARPAHTGRPRDQTAERPPPGG